MAMVKISRSTHEAAKQSSHQQQQQAQKSKKRKDRKGWWRSLLATNGWIQMATHTGKGMHKSLS